MIETTHNPFDKSYWASCLRENLTISSYGEGLETDRASAKAPRQSLTRQTWHKVLKSGCKVEDCRLEEAERLKRHLALFSIIAIRLMYVTYLARAEPELPATCVFSAAELEALHVRVKKTLPPATPPSVRDAVRMLGGLGGHLGRKCDKEPGITVVWRGFMRLHEDVAVLHAHKQALGLIDSS